jgi:hypothetical protein
MKKDTEADQLCYFRRNVTHHTKTSELIKLIGGFLIIVTSEPQTLSWNVPLAVTCLTT